MYRTMHSAEGAARRTRWPFQFFFTCGLSDTAPHPDALAIRCIAYSTFSVHEHHLLCSLERGLKASGACSEATTCKHSQMHLAQVSLGAVSYKLGTDVDANCEIVAEAHNLFGVAARHL